MKKFSIILSFSLTLFLLISCKGTSKDNPKEYQMETVSSKITPEMVTVKYLLEIQTNAAFCQATVNGIPLFDNFAYDSGTVKTSILASAFLENGKNEIGLLFSPFKYDKNPSCDIILTANFPDKQIELTSISATVDPEGDPTSITSKEYPEKHKTSRITEGGYQTKEGLDFLMTREITLQSLPEWAWTKATPLPDSPETYARLQDAYIKLGLMFKNNDYESFKKTVWLAIYESALADTLDPEFYFETTDFPKKFSQGVSSAPAPKWSDFKLKLYKGGRLARIVNRYGITPVEYKQSNGEIYFYNCYFSLIDGKLVVAR
ncbi:hypothetical protein [Halodesulfovibrio aestuarii]|uniref:hypothetical protein n=1 Tax=Halodesulfovibrio aestuarii TaxID=126333 RepID=UPI003D328ECE